MRNEQFRCVDEVVALEVALGDAGLLFAVLMMTVVEGGGVVD